MKNKAEIVLDQIKFPYRGMEIEERDLYFKIIRNCESLSDIDEIVQMGFVQEEKNVVNINGLAVKGDGVDKERICLDASIYLEKESIIVDMLVTKLKVQEERKVFRNADEFIVENDTLVRISEMNNKAIIKNKDSVSIIDFIINQSKKGRTK